MPASDELLTNCDSVSLDRAEDLCRRKKPAKALPFLLKAMEDGNNLDAFVQAAYLFPLPEALKALENAEAKGESSYGTVSFGNNYLSWTGKEGLKQLLGATCFDDGSEEVGKYYSILETRPYMRVLQAQVKLYFDAGLFGKSSYVFRCALFVGSDTLSIDEGTL